jgi:hypothetical protein
LGEINSKPAILLVEKLHFEEKECEQLVAERFDGIEFTQTNDIYSWGTIVCKPKAPFQDYKFSVISPATDTVHLSR